MDEQLLSYLKGRRLWPDFGAEYANQIQWDDLAGKLNVSHIPFVQMKVDDLYRQYVSETSFPEEDLETLINEFNDPDTTVYKEATGIIDGLGLRNFQKEIQTNPVINDKADASGLRQSLLAKSENMDNTITQVAQAPPKEKAKLPIREMPRLSKTERRMSLDLMHLNPDYLNQKKDATRPGLHKRNSSLSKPAPVSTSNVNVITKAEVNAPKTPVNTIDSSSKVPIKNRLRDVLKNFKFGLGRKQDGLNKKNDKDTNVFLFNQLGQKLRKSSNDPKLAEPEADPTSEEYPVTPRPGFNDTTKQNRRASMVGESLPLYIRKQLEVTSQQQDDKSTARSGSYKKPEKSRDIPHNVNNKSTVSRKPSRVHNLLANSQSLYIHSKDVNNPTFKQSPATSNNQTDETSFYENETTSDNDKEYILPTLFTKYYGPGYGEEAASDDDEVSNGIEEMDVDFVNITASFEADDVNERDDDEDEEDDYLFTM